MFKDSNANLLQTLEHLHYAIKFSGQTFVLVLLNTKLSPLLVDLCLLNTAKIRTIIVAEAAAILPQKTALEHLGFVIQTVTEPSNNLGLSSGFGKPVILAYSLNQPAAAQKLESLAFLVAADCKANKIFLLSNEQTELKQQDKTVSCISTTQLEQALQNKAVFNVPQPKLQQWLEEIKNHQFEIIMLENLEGKLFKEVFTHLGSGSLIALQNHNTVRSATNADIMEVWFLIKHYVEINLLLPISEWELVENIQNYFVHQVNQSIIGCATLENHGDMLELRSFCTTEKHQNQGHAQKFVKNMLQQALQQNKKALFALSTQPRVWDFFLRLGFQSISRQQLPKNWQKKYDFSRLSKAFIYYFATNSASNLESQRNADA